MRNGPKQGAFGGLTKLKKLTLWTGPKKFPFGKLTKSRKSRFCTCGKSLGSPTQPPSALWYGSSTVRLTQSNILLFSSGNFCYCFLFIIIWYGTTTQHRCPHDFRHVQKLDFREFVSSPKGTFFEPVQNVSFVSEKKKSKNVKTPSLVPDPPSSYRIFLLSSSRLYALTRLGFSLVLQTQGLNLLFHSATETR